MGKMRNDYEQQIGWGERRGMDERMKRYHGEKGLKMSISTPYALNSLNNPGVTQNIHL